MEMLSRLARAARAARGLRAQILPLRAWLPEIPLADGFASAAILNGVANIIPRRDRLLAELFRVLLPGGRLFIADVLRLGEVDVSMREDPDAWAFCVAGAGSPDEWRDALLLAGFRDIEVEIAETFPPLARGVLRAGKPR
jgi:SAM-dependent methyltransferase